MFEHLMDRDEAAPPSTTLVEYAVEMKTIKEKLEGVELARKKLQERYDELRKRVIPDALAEAELQSIRLVTGELVHTRTEVRAGVAKADQETFHQWLRDNGLGSLIVPTVNAQTLSAWVRERRENNLPVPPQVSVFAEVITVIKKGSAKESE